MTYEIHGWADVVFLRGGSRRVCAFNTVIDYAKFAKELATLVAVY